MSREMLYAEDVKQRVLFLCTHNSVRSQMAEGLLRMLAGDRCEAASAGIEQTSVHPEAIRVMAEIDVDISGQDSETIDRYLGQHFDWVITVCDDAAEACPTFPGPGNRLHWSLPDPSQVTADPQARLGAFRTVRDELQALISQFAAQLRGPATSHTGP